MLRIFACSLLLAMVASAQPKRILYITHSAGYRHESIDVSREVLQSLNPSAIEVVPTEDLSLISRDNLRAFDAVLFFTSGELALSAEQKTVLLEFIRAGKGFGGVHSATDTLYSWPEYGEMIGGYFDGHPWVHEVGIDVEEPEHPIVQHLGNSFRLLEEIYQFRSFQRSNVRVLLTLDTRTVDRNAPGVNRTDGDFALAWTRNYGEGRVFYTALGHFDETWRDQRFQELMKNALLWLSRSIDAPSEPRVASPTPGAVRKPAENRIAAGSLITLEGSRLTSGSTARAQSFPLPTKLAGSAVLVNGKPVPLLSVAPEIIEAQVPFDLPEGDTRVEVVAGSASVSSPLTVQTRRTVPQLLAAAADPESKIVILYATGLGAVTPAVEVGQAAPMSPLSRLLEAPEVSVNDETAQVTFAGLAPGLAGIYQINAQMHALPDGQIRVVIKISDAASNALLLGIGNWE